VPIRNLENVNKIHMALRNGTLTKLDAKFRFKLMDKGTLLCWAEKKNGGK